MCMLWHFWKALEADAREFQNWMDCCHQKCLRLQRFSSAKMTVFDVVDGTPHIRLRGTFVLAVCEPGWQLGLLGYACPKQGIHNGKWV